MLVIRVEFKKFQISLWFRIDNENEFYRKVNEFVKYECDLEEGEYIEDLQEDLINQVNEL